MKNVLKPLTSPAAIQASRFAIGLVMIVAALAKIGDPGTFAVQIRHYRMTPPGAENLLGSVLPWIELMAGLALVLRVRARSGAWLAAGLMGIFTLAVGMAIARGLDIECGCFGTADATRVGAGKLLENFALVAVALIASARVPAAAVEPRQP